LPFVLFPVLLNSRGNALLASEKQQKPKKKPKKLKKKPKKKEKKKKKQALGRLAQCIHETQKNMFYELLLLIVELVL
jgi:hypothetical protein